MTIETKDKMVQKDELEIKGRLHIKDRLIEIVKEAAKLMMNADFEITQKEGFANIVTSTDVAVQDFLCKKLAELLPGSRFLCEEDDMKESASDNENGSNDRYTWIIDPIDGTANFSRGIDQCAICVALKSSSVILGVVYIPRTDELFFAEKGSGAYLNGKKIHVSDRPFGNGILCTALPVYHKEYAPLCSKIILEAFQKCNDIRRFGACAPELCYLAMGRCEMYFEYLLSPWDFAAASLIVTEAGGVITGLDGKTPAFTEPSGIVAANSNESLAEMISLINKHSH